jgi:putative DNA primase/helicase
MKVPVAETLVKELTGGDAVRARRMREDFLQFSPTHKVWLAANHKPIIRGTDWGIWRRIKLVTFTIEITDEEQDKDLPLKLTAEAAGILNWALLACIEWLADGLSSSARTTSGTWTANWPELDFWTSEFVAAVHWFSQTAT